MKIQSFIILAVFAAFPMIQPTSLQAVAPAAPAANAADAERKAKFQEIKKQAMQRPKLRL